MECNLSGRVKELCKMKGLQLKDLANKMGIAPESLSRTINGNPQLSTLKGIADNLGVSMSDLFIKHQQIPLNAIIVYNDKTYVANELHKLEKPHNFAPFGQTRIVHLGHNMIAPFKVLVKGVNFILPF